MRHTTKTYSLTCQGVKINITTLQVDEAFVVLWFLGAWVRLIQVKVIVQKVTGEFRQLGKSLPLILDALVCHRLHSSRQRHYVLSSGTDIIETFLNKENYFNDSYLHLMKETPTGTSVSARFVFLVRIDSRQFQLTLVDKVTTSPKSYQAANLKLTLLPAHPLGSAWK